MNLETNTIGRARWTLALLASLTAAGAAISVTGIAADPDPEHVSCCSVAVDETVQAEPATPTSPPTQTPTETTTAQLAAEATAVPGGVTIHGVATVSAKWELKKPDLSRVVIYLASHSELDRVPIGADHITVAQRNKTFIPNFAVIARGTTVEFPNWDDFDHNVFSRSKAAPAFDLDRYPKGQSKSRVFEKTGIVQVFCNIHPQMRAAIYVTPNQFFAQADAEGRFELTNVPPGQFEIVAWHERCGEQRQPIEVGAESPAPVAFTLEENRQSIMANDPPKREKEYGIERGLAVKREKLNLPVVEESHPAPDGPPN